MNRMTIPAAVVVAAAHRLEKAELLLGDGATVLDDHWSQLHRDFHMSLLAACPSDRQKAVCASLFDQAERYRRFSARHRISAHSKHREHRRILDAVLKRDAEIACWRAVAQGADPGAEQATLAANLTVLDGEFAFVASCNAGVEAMDPADVARLRHIATRTWLRTLDDRLGVSDDALRRMGPGPALPVCEALIGDKAEHRIPRSLEDAIPADNPWGFRLQVPELLYNRGELTNLCIDRGTLTEEDRFKINEHIVQTIRMLSELPFPRHLRAVPEIAGGHHEKMDGSGYPRGLKGGEMSLVARMMAIADIFEALTAVDRPYKTGKRLSEAVSIMAGMRDRGHIDPDLFALFLRSGVDFKRLRDEIPFALNVLKRNTVAELGSGGAAELNNAATLSVASTLSPYADLQVSNLDVSPAAGWAPGSQVTLSWRDVNAGVGATSGGWTDSIVVRNLSTGRTFYVGSLAYDATANGDLGAGDGRDRQLTLVWPADAQGIGRFEFSVVADAQGQIFENNANDSAESNNTAALTVTSAPDLVVGNLRTSPTSTESGATVTVQWDTVNQGLAGTLGSWVERVTVVNPATGETIQIAASKGVKVAAGSKLKAAAKG